MVLFKIVNGVEVQLTKKQEATHISDSKRNKDKREKLDGQVGYLRRRRKEYIPKNEQLEAICAQFQKMKDEGAVLDPLADEWVTSTQVINKRYPPGSKGRI